MNTRTKVMSMKRFMQALMLIIITNNAQAALTGNQLLESCELFLNKNAHDKTSYFLQGNCIGYLGGFSDMNLVYRALMFAGARSGEAFYCMPKGLPIEQQARIVVKFLKDNPPTLHLPVAVLVNKAYSNAYPCE